MMKTLKYLFGISIALLLFTACKKDLFGDTSFAANATKAAKLSVLFDITQDNTGLVTITPNGEGAIAYDVYYGDATATAVRLTAGKSTTHRYAEGLYPVKIVGYNISGQTTEITQPLTVSFKAPENLKVTVSTNVLTVNISATAQYETFFKVYYGDSTTANPVPFTPFLEGQTVAHTYATAGTYLIKVVALSGGAATTTFLDTIKIAKQIDLPVNFDDNSVDYSVVDFGGNQSAVAIDPVFSGNHVMKSIKTAGAQVWAGTTIGTGLGFATRIPIKNSFTRMSIKVYSPAAGMDVKLKIEDHNDATHSVETDTKTTVANQWEILVFDFKSPAPGTAAINAGYSYDKASVFFDFGNNGTGGVFYFDDVKMMPASLKQLKLPVTFNDATMDYTMTDFGGNESSLAPDPVSNGNNVMKATKTTGAQVWAGTTIGTGAGFANPIPVSSSASKMSIKVYAPAAGLDIKLKIEDHNNPGHSVETDTKTTLANQWEIIVFDFNHPAAGTAGLNAAFVYDKASVFFDFGNNGNGKSYYFDAVQMLAASLSQINLPVTFDDATVDYTITDFGSNQSIVANDPTNAGNKVLKSIKTSGAQPWAGTTIGTAMGFANRIPVSASATKLSIRIYSPAAGIDIKLKIEDHNDGSHAVETDTKTTVANQWETLVFDFSKQAPGTPTLNAGFNYDKASVFFDFGNSGDGRTYYTDDIKMVSNSANTGSGLSQINLPVTFDDPTVDYTLSDFGSNSSVVTTDPTNAGNKVGFTTKPAGAQSWAGTTIGTGLGFSSPIAISSSRTTMSVRVYSPAVGMDIKLKIEDHNDPTKSVETDTKSTVANQWEILVFDFSKPAAGTAAINAGYTYDKASIFFDFGNAGNGAIFYWDDVKFL